MAFQGAQNQPDLVGLALNLMQMRRDRELQERKMRLDEMKLAFDQQQAGIQAAREAEDFRLSKLEREAALKDKGFNFSSAQDKLEMGTGGELLGIVNDNAATEADRYSAARRFNQLVLQQTAPGLDRAPELVGANAGSGLASMGQQERFAARVKDEDATRQERFTIRAEGRAEQRTIAAENREADRKAKAAELKAQAERTAMENGGAFDEKAVKELAAANRKENEAAYEMQRKLKMLSKLDPTSRADTLKAINLVQREIDPSQVTDGNIRMWAAAGVDNGAKFAARLEAYLTGTVAIPDELGPVMIQQLRDQLELKTEEIVTRYDAQQQYMTENGFQPWQRKMATTDTKVIGELKERIASRPGRGASADFGPPAARRIVSGNQAAALGLR